MKILFHIFWLLCIASQSLFAAEKPTIRLGVLPFGTVYWELTVLTKQGLIETDEYRIEIQAVANPQAGKIALLANSVDIIISDWIWVSRQRAADFDLTFYPYSNTAGALVVNKQSDITSLQDLKGKRLGIAGSELDKNWLLLQALAKQKNLDLDQAVKKVFAAPPLLNQQLLQGRLDAIITYWHYAARLETQGFHQIVNGKIILQELGVSVSVPPLGYVFKQSWAKRNQNAINSFFKATRVAKNSICSSDSTWQQVIPLTKISSPKTQQLLRKRYCDGRVNQWGKQQLDAAQQIYLLLKKLSNNKLTGESERLQPGTFWFPNLVSLISVSQRD
jgi:NitT/TauT family transport system substrate-binding protein